MKAHKWLTFFLKTHTLLLVVIYLDMKGKLDYNTLTQAGFSDSEIKEFLDKNPNIKLVNSPVDAMKQALSKNGGATIANNPQNAIQPSTASIEQPSANPHSSEVSMRGTGGGRLEKALGIKGHHSRMYGVGGGSNSFLDTFSNAGKNIENNVSAGYQAIANILNGTPEKNTNAQNKAVAKAIMTNKNAPSPDLSVSPTSVQSAQQPTPQAIAQGNKAVNSPGYQFTQGAIGAPDANVTGAPVSNPLTMTASQAYSPYGAGVAASLGAGIVAGAGERVPQTIEDILGMGKEALVNGAAQRGGLQAGFIGDGSDIGNYGRATQAPKANVTRTGNPLVDKIFNAGKEEGMRINPMLQSDSSVKFANPEGVQFSSPQPPGEFQPGNTIPNPNAVTQQEEPAANTLTSTKPSDILKKIFGDSVEDEGSAEEVGNTGTTTGTKKGNIITNQPAWAKAIEGLGVTYGAIKGAEQIPGLFNTLTAPSGSGASTTFSDLNTIRQRAGNPNAASVVDQNGNAIFPDVSNFSSLPQKQAAKIPNTSDVFQHGVMPYQVKQAQQTLQADTQALQANPRNIELQAKVKSDADNYNALNSQMSTDLENYYKTHPQNDTLVDNFLNRDGDAIKTVTNLIDKGGALPKDGAGALSNMLSPEQSIQDKNPAYAGLYSSIKVLEHDGVIPQGTVTKDMTVKAAKQALNKALQAYYGKLMQVVPNYRNTIDYTSPGASILHAQTSAITNGTSATSTPTVSPTPAIPEPSPTMTQYQKDVQQLTTPPSPVSFTPIHIGGM